VFENTTLNNTGFCGYIAKYDADGNFKWVNRAANFLEAVAVDKWGYIYVTGNIVNSDIFTGNNNTIQVTTRGGFDVGIAKYAPDGNLLWVRTAGSAAEEYANGIAVDDEGNCYVTGHYKAEAEFGSFILPYEKEPATTYRPTRYFITKLDKDGNFIWARYAYSSQIGFGTVSGISININSAGKVLVSGKNHTASAVLIFEGGTNLSSTQNATGAGFIACYSSDGDLVWVHSIKIADCLPITSDTLNNFYVASNKVLYKYDVEGLLVYEKEIIFDNYNGNNR
ncbi:MAG: SBBP repeat-containing protein, partial [Bacteroidetes bacterium]|nr:SBBP repeat-containing protein [Bacteroidota bacterium]